MPATRPERMSREAPPCSAEITTSRVWRLLTEVKALTSSGIRAPARVPRETIAAIFHHIPSPSSPISRAELRKVRAIDSSEVIHTSSRTWISGSCTASRTKVTMATPVTP